MKLNINEVQFDTASYADPNGRLFHWDGGIYRAISPKISPLYSSLLKERVLEKLFDCGLIETEITTLELEGYGIILRHRKIPFVSFGFEWCGEMLKDAALLVLDLNLKLAELGYELHDANPWNVLFDGCIPKYIDFGSIVPISSKPDKWPPRWEFFKSFLNPLLLISQGRRKIAREMLRDWRKWGVPDKELLEILPFGEKCKHKFQKFLYRDYFFLDRKTALTRLRKMVERIQFIIPETEWTNYYKEYVSLDTPAEWTPKQNVANAVLSQLSPKTVLDIGSNTGWYSEMAAKNGCKVVALDIDEPCVQLLYNRFIARPDVLPLLIDFSRPTPPHGTEKMEFRSATERFQCDLVFAMGLVHHLVFKGGMQFDYIADLLSQFVKRSLLVEFVPKEDRYVSEWYNENYSWYTLDNFVQALERGFSGISILPSNRPPRNLLLCERTKDRSASPSRQDT